MNLKTDLKNNLSIIVIPIIYLLLIGIIYFFVKDNINQELIEQKLSIERAIFDTYIVSKTEKYDPEDVFIKNNITKFVLYERQDEILYSYGNLTEDFYQKYNRNLFLNKEANNLIYKKNKLIYFGFPRPIKNEFQTEYFAPFYTKDYEEYIENTDIENRPMLYIEKESEEFNNKILHIHSLEILSYILLFIIEFIFYLYVAKLKKVKKMLIEKTNFATMNTAVRTLSHEIKNPLASILIQSAIIKKMAPNVSTEIDIINQEVARLNTLTNKTNDFLTNPIGEREDINIYDFCFELKSRFSNNIVIDCNDKDIIISFDRLRLRSVIENLIKNASESTENKDSPIEIVIKKFKKDSLLLEINDEGDGIDEKIIKKVFMPFYTTKINGSGIGLSICKKFIEANGGTISIKNRFPHGCSVSLYLKRKTL